MEQYKINGREKKSIIVENNVVKIIKSKGLISNLMEKIIPIESIVGVEVEKPGRIWAGFIRFQTAGNSNYNNSIIFADNKDYEIALKIKEYIKNYVEKSIDVFNQNLNDTDVISQLEKLAELKDKGVLSEEEFQAQKQKLLNI